MAGASVCSSKKHYCLNLLNIKAARVSGLAIAITAILILMALTVFLPATMGASLNPGIEDGPTKQNANLTLQASSSSVNIDDVFTLSGTLSPPKTGTVTLYWSINCTCFNHFQVLIMTDGQYSKVFSPNSPGLWYFKVSWGGDSEYNSAFSEIVTVSVSQPSVQTTSVTFSADGIAEDAGVVLSVDNINYTVAQLPLAFKWKVGSSHPYTWYSPVVSSANYTWSSTEGLSTLQYGNLTVNSGGGSITASYESSLQTASMTFSAQGMSGYSGVVLNVDGNDYDAAQLPKNFTWQVNSSHSFAWYSPLGPPTAQFTWSSTSGSASTQAGNVVLGSEGGNVTATYQLSSPNRSPIPVISFDPAMVWTGLNVTFDASASYDPDGTIATFAWDFGDFTSSSGAVASHAYGVAGYYIVVLTVVDERGAEGRASATIEVTGTFPLNVTSNVGIAMEGSGVYPAGSTVQISSPADLPVPGIMGSLGSRYAFQQWTGAVSSTQRTVSVTVDYQASQLGLVALYTEQNNAAMMTIAAIAAVAMVAASLLALLVVWRRKSPLYYALALIMVIVGITGTVLGIYFAQQYWFDTGHPIVCSLGQLATIVGPIVAVIGVALLVALMAMKK